MGNEVQNLTGGFTTNRTENDLFQTDNLLMPDACNDEPFAFRPFGFQEKTLFNTGDLIRTNLNARADRLTIPRMESASEVRLAKINPQLADRIRLMAADLKRQGIDVVVAPKGDLRTVEQQNELYKIGRRGIDGEKPVTWVKGGNSYHNYGLAVDIVLKDKDGNPTWDAKPSTWKAIGQAGERQGLEWGGRWSPKNRDEAHFQLTGGAKTASQWRATYEKGGLPAVWNGVNSHSKPADGSVSTQTPPQSSSSLPVPTALLKRHSHSEQVKQLQDALFALGYKQLDPAKIGRGHGNFGPITDAGLRDFQRKHNLVPDGIYGPKTQAALREALGKTGGATNQPTATTTANAEQSPKLSPTTSAKSNGLPTTTEEANKLFKTQFHSKWNSTKHTRSNDCGPASLEATLEAVGVHKASHSQESIDRTRALMGAGTYHDTTDWKQIRNGAQRADATVSVVSQNGWHEIDNALNSGKAIVVNGRHEDVYRSAFGGKYHATDGGKGHFIAIVGHTSDGKYIVADSMCDGGTAALTKKQLENFFYPKGGSHLPSKLIIIGNPRGNNGNQSTQPSTSATPTTKTNQPSTTTSGVSARQIAGANHILAGSGLAGKGETILRLAKKYNVPAEFAIAIFRKEASFAQPGTLAARNNNPGNIKFAHQDGAVLGAKDFAHWKTMDKGIEGFFKLMNNKPYRGFVDNKDYKSLIYRYAPPEDNNDSAGYVKEIQQWITKYHNQIHAG